MIRLPATHAAITAPLVASSTQFPGVPIGRSQTDGRPFHLSPVKVDERALPSTNSLALGGIGSGKSTTDKVWLRREILNHGHQAVVIDSYGEQTAAGEWAALTRSLGGLVVEAGKFSLNPCSPELGIDVREQLLRSLIAAVEPDALTPQATHALQHAVNSPKADRLAGLVDALVDPEDGRWPAEKLAGWGEPVAIALSRYTEGSLRGLFDGPDAGLPPTDLPVVSFDFSSLDRNSPAIPALMAAITCWVEQVWLKQATAVHRHVILEEAWQILISPATAALIQRMLKNSRKAALSLKVLVHTLSDLGEGRARDLAKLIEIVHVGRLGPEEAAIVGAILGLPAWAIKKIPTLAQGEAVWKIADFCDVIQTVLLDQEEVRLTDTSTRRRKAQEALRADADDEESAVVMDKEEVPEEAEESAPYESDADSAIGEEDGWGDAWDAGLDIVLPPNVVDTLYIAPQRDHRHHAVLQAAGAGRISEASDLAALGEREDITAHGIHSPEATEWLLTRAEIAEQAGNTSQAAQLRATVHRMGHNAGSSWWHQDPPPSGAPQHRPPDNPEPNREAESEPAPAVGGDQRRANRRRAWLTASAAATLALAITAVWQQADQAATQDDLKAQAAAYKGRSGAGLVLDSIDADVTARWTQDRASVIITLKAPFNRDVRYLRVDGGGKSADSIKKDWYPKSPEIRLPVTDPYADVTVRVAVGGADWTENSRAASRTVRLSPTGVAYDGQTGEKLPSDL
ncbi:hypothetical protein ACFYVL_43935 [Streptomyces sp. NPDC004111]|uniref:hypothetical protein n=1 Tax=Streptomyces sp. NPDC004111 TaxID=3364690 RepID=UPI0036B2EB01